MNKLFIILFFLPLFFFSQNEEEYLIKNLHSLSVKNPKWKKLESKISLEEKIKLITPLFFDDSEQYCKGDSITNPQQFLNYYASVFHFTDIDNDKDIDLVFSGMECPADEAGKVNVYINQNNTLQKTFSEYGKIVELTKNKSLIIYTYPCCAMTINTLGYYSISKDASAPIVAVSFHKYWFAETKAKTLPTKLKACKTITLTKSAKVNMAAQDSTFETPGPIKTVTIANTKDGATAKIYGSYTDKAKQKWLFVKLAFTDVMQDEIIPNINIRKTALLGWIKEPK